MRNIRPFGRTTTIGAALALLLLSACGGSSSLGADQAKSTVKTFLSSAARGDGTKACGELTTDVQQRIATAASSTCSTYISALGARTPPQERAEIDRIEPRVRVRGSTATAIYRSVRRRGTKRLILQRLGGNWRISALPRGG